MVKLIAIRPLYNPKVYGTVGSGQIFEAPEDIAESLESRGLAELYIERKAIYASPENKMLIPTENKVIIPAENKAKEENHAQETNEPSGLAGRADISVDPGYGARHVLGGRRDKFKRRR
jgi:hypothetical protein